MKKNDTLLSYNIIYSTSHLKLVCLVYIVHNTKNVITEFRVDDSRVNANPANETFKDYFEAKERLHKLMEEYLADMRVNKYNYY